MACSAMHHLTLTISAKNFPLQKYSIYGEPILHISQLNNIHPRHPIAAFPKCVEEIDPYFYFINLFHDPQVNIVSQILPFTTFNFTLYR